jgi:hypothetical protein
MKGVLFFLKNRVFQLIKGSHMPAYIVHMLHDTVIDVLKNQGPCIRESKKEKKKCSSRS